MVSLNSDITKTAIKASPSSNSKQHILPIPLERGKSILPQKKKSQLLSEKNKVFNQEQGSCKRRESFQVNWPGSTCKRRSSYHHERIESHLNLENWYSTIMPRENLKLFRKKNHNVNYWAVGLILVDIIDLWVTFCQYSCFEFVVPSGLVFIESTQREPTGFLLTSASGTVSNTWFSINDSISSFMASIQSCLHDEPIACS